ncbi:MAG: type II toxin-antitoxin system VapC family toxin [Catenulispora sp.]
MIILDTNVVSELMRAVPDPTVAAWAVNADPDMCVTALTVAEIRYGIARLPEGQRKHDIMAAANKLLTAFAQRIVPFDLTAATRYGDLVADREANGRPISVFDAQIAAVCQARSATLATRNAKDFEDTGVTVVDPWSR